MNSSPDTTLHDALRVLRAQSTVIVSVVALSIGTAVGLSTAQDKRYHATASLAFEDLSEDFALVGVPGSGADSESSRVFRSSQTLLRAGVLADAGRKLNPPRSVAVIRRQVKATSDAASGLVMVTATTPSAASAAAIANAVASAAKNRETMRTRQRFTLAARDLEKRFNDLSAEDRNDAGTRSVYKERISRLQALASVAAPVKLAESAQRPGSPFSPKPVRAGIVAGFVGLVIGLGLALLRNALDRRLRGSEQISSRLDLPLVGQIREEAMGKAGNASASVKPLSDIDQEAFRILRSNLEMLDAHREVKTVLVTSPLPQEGKSTVAASLAYACSAFGRRTLLLECDLRRPSLSTRLGLNGSPGLVEFLDGEATSDDVVHFVHATSAAETSSDGSRLQSDPDGKLACLLAGRPTNQPGLLLGSARFEQLIQTARATYDMVIVDSAPLLPVVDTRELFPFVDAVILCIRDGQTTGDQAEAGRAILSNMHDRSVGLVVTGISMRDSMDYGYYYSDKTQAG